MITSLAFPKMFAANKVTIKVNEEATTLNIRLLLASKVKEFFGDPEFGTKLIHLLFKNNSPILADVVKDILSQTINNYIPLVTLSREDIELYLDITDLIVRINVKSQGMNTELNINIAMEE